MSDESEKIQSEIRRLVSELTRESTKARRDQVVTIGRNLEALGAKLTPEYIECSERYISGELDLSAFSDCLMKQLQESGL